MIRGETLVLDLLVKQANGAPQDLTGAKIWMTAKTAYAQPDSISIFQVSTLNGGIVITDPASGLATVTVAANLTRNRPDADEELVYDIRLRDAGGFVSTLESGILVVSPSATLAIA